MHQAGPKFSYNCTCMPSELSESSSSETFRQPCKDPTMAERRGVTFAF